MEANVDHLKIEVDSLKSPHSKQATEFFNLLVKATKARLVYPSSSKLPDQFKEELAQRAAVIFDEVDSLNYKIGPGVIQYGDHKVYESTSRSENFAHVFFKDGIINLSFWRDISAVELGNFIDLVARMMRTVYVDDDLATLMWEENFTNIHYELIDEGMEIDAIEYTSDKLKPKKRTSADDIQSIYLDEGEITFDEEDFNLPEGGSDLRKKGQAYSQMPQTTHDFLNRISEFTGEEKERLSKLVNDDARFDFTEYILTVIFEILGTEKELSGYSETLKFISRVRDNFIGLGNFSGAAALLKRIKEMQVILKNLQSPRAEKIDGFLLECASAEKINMVTETINQMKDIEADGLHDYLTQLPWAAIDPLVSSLGDLKFYRPRRTVCMALTELGKEHVDLIARGLDDDRWYVVRNVVMILGQIGEPRILNYLKKTIRHSDYRVRKETLQAAASVEGADNYDFMVLALSDSDTKIQMSSLHYLVEKKCVRAAKAIEHIVKNSKFKDRTPDQAKKFLEAYGSLGQNNALPYLKHLALKRNFLASARDERLKLNAISALGKINTTEALNMLKKLANNKKDKIAVAASRALGKSTRIK